MASKVKRLVRLFFLIGILAVAFITNPDKSDHVEKINNKIYELLPQSEKKSVIKSISIAVSDKVLKQLIHVDNYFLFSVSKIEIMGRSETVGYGVFGIVILTEKVREIDV